MKKQITNQKGGVLLVVLVLMLIGAAITAGWIALMNAEILYGEQMFSAMKRRIGFENTTAMVRQYALTQILTKDGAASATADAGNGWGSLSIPEVSTTPLGTFQKAAGVNHFNPGDGDGYSADFTVEMTAGEETIHRRVHVKSRSPLLSRTTVILGNTATGVSGSLLSLGQSLVWNADGSYDLRSVGYLTSFAPSTLWLDLEGQALAPSNFPFIPLTGSESDGEPDFSGGLHVVANSTGINSLAVLANTSAPNGVQSVDGTSTSDENGVVSDGEGHVEIYLSDPLLGNVLITGGVSQLTLKGQSTAAEREAAEREAAISIVIHQGSESVNLAQVVFTNMNGRRVALGMRKDLSDDCTFVFPQAGMGIWRLLLVLENVSGFFDLGSGTQTLIGGIQTDQSFSILNGTLRCVSESDPKLLDRLTARDGWVEVFSQ